jgi:RNA polymerase sigma-70 factor (ECF subfamily)
MINERHDHNSERQLANTSPPSSLEGELAGNRLDIDQTVRGTTSQVVESPVAHAAASAYEADLIKRICAGENDLFIDLVRPYQKMVFAMAVTIVKNDHDAEEVAQEALFKAFKNLSRFRGEAKFSTWIVQIALNEARLRLRNQKRATEQSLDCGMENEEGDHVPIDLADWREIPSEALHRKELRKALRSAISSLKPIYRDVLVLRDIEQFSVAETAKSLNISEGSVKTRLLRARLQVRDALAPGFDGYWNTGSNEYRRVRPF